MSININCYAVMIQTRKNKYMLTKFIYNKYTYKYNISEKCSICQSVHLVLYMYAFCVIYVHLVHTADCLLAPENF